MIKGILFFVLVWLLVSVGITVFRSLSGREKFNVITLMSYSAVTALISTVLIVGFVLLF